MSNDSHYNPVYITVAVECIQDLVCILCQHQKSLCNDGPMLWPWCTTCFESIEFGWVASDCIGLGHCCLNAQLDNRKGSRASQSTRCGNWCATDAPCSMRKSKRILLNAPCLSGVRAARVLGECYNSQGDMKQIKNDIDDITMDSATNYSTSTTRPHQSGHLWTSVHAPRLLAFQMRDRHELVSLHHSSQWAKHLVSWFSVIHQDEAMAWNRADLCQAVLLGKLCFLFRCIPMLHGWFWEGKLFHCLLLPFLNWNSPKYQMKNLNWFLSTIQISPPSTLEELHLSTKNVRGWGVAWPISGEYPFIHFYFVGCSANIPLGPSFKFWWFSDYVHHIRNIHISVIPSCWNTYTDYHQCWQLLCCSCMPSSTSWWSTSDKTLMSCSTVSMPPPPYTALLPTCQFFLYY